MFIAPKSMVSLSRRGDAHFIIPQNAMDEYSHIRKFKMLDNGAYEGEAVPWSILLDYAKKMRVHEIVIPDVMRDATLTLKNAKGLIDMVPSRYRSALVPQGKDLLELIDCFKKLEKLEPDTMCFPKWLGLNRPLVVNYLMRKGLLKRQVHLLGLDNLHELYGYHPLTFPLIRSVDTSKPFTFARYGMTLRVFEDRHFNRVPMNIPEFGKMQKKLVEKNMRVILDVTRKL